MSKIFISFKNTDKNKLTEDYGIAKLLESMLHKNGFEVFFSEVSLLETARSDYKAVIDRELDNAEILILIGTKAEYITSPWVKYEWDNFLQNIISGIKPDSEIFCLFSNIQPNEKPIGIRFKQTFSADVSGISSLIGYVCSKMNKQAKTLYVCKNCGKVFDPHNRDTCRFHSQNAVYSKIKNFDGSERKSWIFPCCGKRLICDDETTPPSRSDGCIIGKHVL